MRYWKRLNSDGTINTVESYSHNGEIEGAVEIAEGEFNAFIASPTSLPSPITLDWRSNWLAADTPAKKLSVLGQMLGLE